MSVTNNRTSFPGHGMLLGPEQFSLGKHANGRDMYLASADDYHLWHATVMGLAKGRRWRGDNPVTVYVNHGKWVADCSACGKGMLTRPDWKLACCTECGAWFDNDLLIFPSDDLVVTALLARPNRDTQHWDFKQTADDLIRENKELLNL